MVQYSGLASKQFIGTEERKWEGDKLHTHDFSLFLHIFPFFHNKQRKTKQDEVSRGVPWNLVLERPNSVLRSSNASWIRDEAVLTPHGPATNSGVASKGYCWFLHEKSRLNDVRGAFILSVCMTVGFLSISALCFNTGAVGMRVAEKQAGRWMPRLVPFV